MFFKIFFQTFFDSCLIVEKGRYDHEYLKKTSKFVVSAT